MRSLDGARVLLVVWALLASSLGCSLGCPLGCAAPRSLEPAELRARLAKLGLAIIDEEEAFIPAAERGRAVPCRTIPGFRRPVLPEHPAGYLIIGVAGRRIESAPEILAAMSRWPPGEKIEVLVRRNPYLLQEPESWDAEVQLWVPAESGGRSP